MPKCVHTEEFERTQQQPPDWWYLAILVDTFMILTALVLLEPRRTDQFVDTLGRVSEPRM